MSVQKLKAGEKVKTSVKVDGKNVSVTCSVGDYVLQTTLDFAGVSHDDLMTLATKTAIIAIQRQWHAAYESDQKAATNANGYGKIDVQNDILQATKRRSKKTDAVKATSILDKLSDEERKVVLEKYAAA